MKNYILIDASYMAFYRFFATLHWFKLAKKEEYEKTQKIKLYNWSKNEIFMEKYKKIFLGSLEKLFGVSVLRESNIIFCCDSEKGEFWRTKIYKEYKGCRVDLSLKTNFKPVFKLTFDKIIPNLIKKNEYNFNIIKINEIEADDIIAIFCKKYKNNKIIILSCDDDFTQLLNDNIAIIDFRIKKKKYLSKKESKLLLKQKIIKGDCSDNIPSIFPKDRKLLNLKERKKILEDKEYLYKFLYQNPLAAHQYNINKKLIDFNYIPNNVKKIILMNLVFFI
jgi:5'-3' exonuclease